MKCLGAWVALVHHKLEAPHLEEAIGFPTKFPLDGSFYFKLSLVFKINRLKPA